MKALGIVRPVDKMGRVVIPKEIRKQLQIQNYVDSFEIFMDGDKIILKKYHPTCIFCDNISDGTKYEGYEICSECIDKISQLKDII